MTHDEAFIQAIREQPDDDAPRLIYADWLEEHEQPDRAEFIRVQCEAARLPRSDPRRQPLVHRAGQLLECHWDDWAGPLRRAIGQRWDRMGNLSLAPRFTSAALRSFPRGFVDSLYVEAPTLLVQPNPFAALAPLRHLGLWGAGSHMKSLAAVSYLAHIERLVFQDHFQSPVNASGLDALAQSPYLGRLTWLGLGHNNVSDDGLAYLAGASWLAGLRMLNLIDNGLTQIGIRSLLDTPFPPRLQLLHLSRNTLGNHAIEALAHSPLLQEVFSLGLADTAIDDRAVDALMASPYLAQLTTLNLNGNPISARARARLRLSQLGSQLTVLHLDP